MTATPTGAPVVTGSGPGDSSAGVNDSTVNVPSVLMPATYCRAVTTTPRLRWTHGEHPDDPDPQRRHQPPGHRVRHLPAQGRGRHRGDGGRSRERLPPPRHR